MQGSADPQAVLLRVDQNHRKQEKKLLKREVRKKEKKEKKARKKAKVEPFCNDEPTNVLGSDDEEPSIKRQKQVLVYVCLGPCGTRSDPPNILVHNYLIVIRYCLILKKKKYYLIFVFKMTQKQ